jgi:competence protein ComEA
MWMRALMTAGVIAAAVLDVTAMSVRSDLRTALAQSGDAPPKPGDQYPTLPPGEGRDVMIRVCSHCHSPESAAGEAYDEAQWKEVVDEMAGKGAEASQDEFDTIVKYLAKAFPPAK